MGFYFMSIAEIEHDELIEEVNVTKSETLIMNDLTPSECSDSVMPSLNLKDACFALEEMPMTTKSSQTLATSDSTSSSSSSKEPSSGSPSSDPSVGDSFLCPLLVFIIFSTVDKSLNRGRRRLNPLDSTDYPTEVKDKTEEELSNHLATKASEFYFFIFS